MMSGRPKEPKYARNKNILVIGGSGSGKTRFFGKMLKRVAEPDADALVLLKLVTDPKGHNPVLKSGMWEDAEAGQDL